MKIINVVGARPNFMKIAPIIREMKKENTIKPILVHTGQHYDNVLSALFFDELGIPKPDIDLEVGSASHAIQTAEIMKKFESIVLKEKPDMILVVGDVNSTIACALVASKLNIKITHVEAGLRSFDRTMPEEINRILTDSISDYLFTTEQSAKQNLINEGISSDKIHFVGNVMIDTLLKHKTTAQKSDILTKLGISSKSYGILTLHRPSNVDNKDNLTTLLNGISQITTKLPIIFPCHPRTEEKLKTFGLNKKFKNILSIIQPLGYLDFLKLMSNAKMVLTDSGGIQEETTVLNVPCITLRENTERPITTTKGTNVLVGLNMQKLIKEGEKILNGEERKGTVPDKWDGNAAKRIVNILIKENL